MTLARVDMSGHGTLEIDDQQWATLAASVARDGSPHRTRLVYAATHVVMLDDYRSVDHRPNSPGDPRSIAAMIDWEATIGLRRHLATHGLGIAEAMDTAQRFELGWVAARRLIEETGRLAPPAGFVAGASTDHLPEVDGPAPLVDGVVEQAKLIQAAGGIPMILPMPWLSTSGAGEATYVDVYRSIVDALDGPIFVHWLGEMFMPALRGYFPGASFDRVMEHDPGVVRGVKLSLLDVEREAAIRSRLLERDQVVLTGDDLSFASLIEGGGVQPARSTRVGDRTVQLGDFSHALLGILDGIAAPAALALRLLDEGRIDDYRRVMAACETLSRIVFEPPTSSYKVGLALLAWLNGLQNNRMLVNHLEHTRDRDHLTRVIVAAAQAGALTDARTAARRCGELGLGARNEEGP